MACSPFSISMKTKNNAVSADAELSPVWLELVRNRVGGLRYGVVQIVIHGGRVTQVESTERVRFPSDTTTASV